MSISNDDALQRLVNELGCKPEAPTFQELIYALIQEQRRTNDVLQNLAESIAQLANSMTDPEMEHLEVDPRGPYAGL